MKASTLFAAVALAASVLVSTTTTSAGPVAKGWVGGRIHFGEQMGFQADGACSAIMVTARYLGGATQVAAVGPNAGAHECDYRFALPLGAIVKLSIKHGDLPSKTQGTWTNPFKVRPGSNVGYDFLMDGKP